jgi:hypothetical protein
MWDDLEGKSYRQKKRPMTGKKMCSRDGKKVSITKLGK